MRHSLALREFPSRGFSLRWFPMVLLMLMAAVTVSSAATEKILHSFEAWPHGYQPSGGLISDAAGNVYGATAAGGTYGYGGVYELTPNSHGGWTETLIYNFPAGTGGSAPLGTVTGPTSPVGTLVFDGAGNLYGAALGGSAGGGTVFELTPHGNGQWTEKALWNFHGEDGFNPYGSLIFDQAGNLYGTTNAGGGIGERLCIDGGCGTVFRLTPGTNGKWTLTTLYRFTGESDGANPNPNLVFDSAGNLYGSTRFGGDVNESLGYGVVFELSPTAGAWTETVLHTFTDGADGGYPGGMISDNAGNFYGETSDGGTGTGCSGFPCGTVFELSLTNGQWTENVLHNFHGSDGDAPEGVLALGAGGTLYGATRYGGTAGDGTVFELTPGANGQWTEAVLWNFVGGNDGSQPTFGVNLGSGGQVYGTAIYGGGTTGNGTVIELTSSGNGKWSEATLTNFADGSGYAPQANLVGDAAGNLYGTSSYGGEYGFGSVFKLVPEANGAWTESVIYNFPTGLISQGRGFGSGPSNLIIDDAGNLYGETEYGGTAGYGTVFELSPAGAGWSEKDLYAFAGGTDGVDPKGGLVRDAAGNLYGTTQTGGDGTGCHRAACGTVFELSASGGGWSKTILYNFAGGTADGENPAGGLVFDGAGNLYGTTVGGGIVGGNNCGIGCGTVYELSPSNGGWKESVLHLFTEKKGDGAIPYGGLVVDAAGNLYGTTSTGGTQNETCGIGCGTVFEMSPVSGGWSETVVYQFTQLGGSQAGLVFDHAGNLYGTTPPSVFELSPKAGGGWSETTVYTFGPAGSGDGNYADGNLMIDESGNLYGTTAGGGGAQGGTVFEITP
jgi:uncharacterized repeat protein (TIGR03803 family)